MIKYYETHIEAATSLSEEQKKDGWSLEDRRTYWQALGYDYFFIQQVVK